MLPDIRIHKLILLRQTYKKNKDDIKPGSLISSFISIKCKSLIKINKHVLFVFPYPQSLPIAPNLRIFNHLTRIVPTITPVLFVFPPIYITEQPGMHDGCVQSLYASHRQPCQCPSVGCGECAVAVLNERNAVGDKLSGKIL